MSCVVCDNPLTGRRKKYCSAGCQKKEGRRVWVQKIYGLTLEEYESILSFQGGSCAICGNEPRGGKVLHIDHQHGGYVRGLLCQYCNQRLVGRLKNHDLAQRLANYLRDPPAIQALGREVIAPGRPKKKRRTRKGRT